MLRSTAIAGAEVSRRRVSADSVGAGLVGAAAGEVGGERRELRGHQQTAAKFSSTLTATLPRSLNATAPKAQRNLPAFTSYVCLMRAREAPSSGASRPTRRCD